MSRGKVALSEVEGSTAKVCVQFFAGMAREPCAEILTLLAGREILTEEAFNRVGHLGGKGPVTNRLSDGCVQSYLTTHAEVVRVD
jgi:hypothetical protein